MWVKDRSISTTENLSVRAFESYKSSLFILRFLAHPQKKTIVAVLDCLISPRWPHPPCLPSDIVPCLSWQQLKDTPTHFHVTYDILESDVNGRLPDDPGYKCTPKSCYYNLAKHCQQTLNKVDKITSTIPVTNCKTSTFYLGSFYLIRVKSPSRTLKTR